MQFVTVRDLRNKSAQIWRKLPGEKEMVLTSNGKPIAILFATSGDTLEESLAIIRQVQSMVAVSCMQTQSAKSGKNLMPLTEINKEIADVRKNRRTK